MEFLLVLGIAVIIVALSFAGLAVKLLLRRNGQFPNIHIGGNKALAERGITCAQSYDKIEQAKAWKNLNSKQMNLLDDTLGSC